MNPEINIREFRTDDSVADITALVHAAYASLAALGFRYYASYQDEAATRRRLQGRAALVAALDKTIVGTVTLYGPVPDSPCLWYRREGIFHFGQFAVHPDFQRQGLGMKLMETVEQYARRLRASEIALDTAEEATHLCEWYRRLGYRFVEHVKWDVTNYRSVVLSKAL